MKVVLLSASNSRLSGGLFYSVKNLGLSMMNHCGVDVSYVCHDDKFSSVDKASFKNLPLAIYHISRLPILKRLGFSRDLLAVLEKEKPDIIDIQGTWMYYSYAAFKYKKKHPEVKIIYTPRGTLDRLPQGKLSLQKKLAMWLYERDNFKNADCFVALCQPEAESMRIFGIQAPIVTIPNGFNLPSCSANVIADENKTLLFVGRINPKKGIKELIEALNILKIESPHLFDGWTLKIAGWDQNNHITFLKDLVKKYNLEDKVIFVGPVYGKDKEDLIKSSQAFVLTSFSEGMPMSVLEAWAYKLPVVMTDGCNLPEGFSSNAAIRVEPNPESIASGLRHLFSLTSAERYLIGKNGHMLVAERFQWDKIAEDTVALFKSLL